MIYLCKDNKSVSKNIMVYKNSDKRNEILKKMKGLKEELLVSYSVVEECSTPKFRNFKTISLDFFQFDSQFDLLREILLCDLNDNSKKQIIESISSFDDFLFFTSELLDGIRIEEIATFDIEKMNEIRQLSEAEGLNCEAADVLSQLDKAKNNYKVLLLSEKYKQL